MAYTFYYEDRKQPDGKRATRKVRHLIGRVPGDMSKRAAEEEHARIMREVNRQRGSVAPAIKGRAFRDATEAWRKAIAPHLSPSTVRQRESHLRTHILPKFGDSAPHTINVEALQQFATDLRKVLSRKSVVQVLVTIFGILTYAEKCGTLVSKVSLDDLQLGSSTDRKETAYFTIEQAAQIIAASKEPYKTLFALAWNTGMRAGEILALTVADLDFRRKTIRVDKTADDNTREIRHPKTKSSVALLPMPSALEAILANYLKHNWKASKAGFLFPNPAGTQPKLRDNVVKYGLKPVLKRLGIPDSNVGLHAFRHGLATELAESAVPLPVLQQQMRHADVRTTLRIYAHAIPSSQRDAIEKLASRSISTVVPISTESQPN